MPTADLTTEQLRIIDQARTKIDQLTKSIESVRRAVAMSHPMPDLASIQAHSNVLLSSLQTVTSHLSTHADLLSTTVAYPSTNYPGRTQEGLAGMLLRKKLEPGVETWVEEGRGVGKTVGEGMERELERMWLYGGGLVAMKEKERGEREEERGSLWEELEGESDEDEDEEMEDVEVEGEGKSVNEKAAKDAAVGGKPDPTKPARTVEQMARFMAAGVMP